MHQALAIAAVRLKTLVRRNRGASGAMNMFVTLLMSVFGLLFALVMAVVFAVFLWSNAGRVGSVRIVQIAAFYIFFVLGVLLPVFRGAIEQGLDLRSLRVFPISSRRLFGITFLATAFNVEHLLYFPSLIALAIATAYTTNIGVGAIVAAFGLMFLCYVSWSQTINLTMAELTRTRRVREVIAIVAFFLIIAFAMGPQVVLDNDGKSRLGQIPVIATLIEIVQHVAGALPPHLAADAMRASQLGSGLETGFLLTLLALWNLVGIVLGYAIFVRYQLGDRSTGRRSKRPKPPRRAAGGTSGSAPEGMAEGVAGHADASALATGAPARFSFDHPWLVMLPAETRAVAAKELRYLLRSVNGRFVLLIVPVFVIMVGAIFPDKVTEPVLGVAPERIMLFGLLIYSAFFSTNFVNNAFGWETEGIKTYFMAPVRLEWVLMGKNLGVCLFNVLVLGLTLGCWMVLMGYPGFVTLASALLLFAIVMVVITTVGNVLSVMFPIRRNMSSIKNSPSQTAVLLSLLSTMLAVSLGLTGLAIAMLLGVPELLPLFLLGVLAVALGAYRFGLTMAARLLDERKDRVVQALRVG